MAESINANSDITAASSYCARQDERNQGGAAEGVTPQLVGRSRVGHTYRRRVGLCAPTAGVMTPESPPESQRSREFSWNSVYVTPYKPMPPNGGVGIINGGDETPVYAPSTTQHSAKRYCCAASVAALVTGTFLSLGSPTILAALDSDWKLLALARLAIGLGSVVPPASLFRSMRVYVRFALRFRVLLWTIVMPALWLMLRSDLLPPVSLRRHASAAICDTAFIASAIALLLADAAAAAVPAAVGASDGFRLEQQLFSEYQVVTPPRMLTTLRRRIAFSTEAGAIFFSPLVAVSTLILASECRETCHPYTPYLLPASLAAFIAFFSLLAACIIKTGGSSSFKRSILRAGGSLVSPLQAAAPIMMLGSGTPDSSHTIRTRQHQHLLPDHHHHQRAQTPASGDIIWAGFDGAVTDRRQASPPININDINFTPTNARRSLDMPPVPSSASEAELLNDLNESVAALAAARAAEAEDCSPKPRGSIYKSRPVFALCARVRRCWRLRGLLSRSCLLAIGLVIEDAIATVALPLLAILYLHVPTSPDRLLWSAVYATAAVSAMRLGRVTVGMCAERLRLFESTVEERDSQQFLALSPSRTPTQSGGGSSGGGSSGGGSSGGGSGGGGSGGDGSGGGGGAHHSPVLSPTDDNASLVFGAMHTISLSSGGRTPARASNPRCGNATPSRIVAVTTTGAGTPSRSLGSPLTLRPSPLGPRNVPPGPLSERPSGGVAPNGGGGNHPPPVRLADCRIPLNGIRDEQNANAENRRLGNGNVPGVPHSPPSMPPLTARPRGLFPHQSRGGSSACSATAGEGVATAAPHAAASAPPAAAAATPPTAFVGASHGPHMAPEFAGGCCSLLCASLAIALAAAALPLALEANSALPALIPYQASAILAVACFLVGGCLALGCGSLRARLAFIADAVYNASANAKRTASNHETSCTNHDGGDASASTISPLEMATPADEWCELVDTLRAVGAMIVQPSLCVALGMLPLRVALWSAAVVAVTSVVVAAGLALLSKCMSCSGENGTPSHLSRGRRGRRCPSQPSTVAAETPETFLMSSREEGGSCHTSSTGSGYGSSPASAQQQ